MTIVGELKLQLSYIKEILIDEKKTGQIILNYKVCLRESSFLNINELLEYITITDVKNFTFIKEIVGLSFDINELLDNEFLSLPIIKIDESEYDFHALYLGKNNIVEYRSLEEKDHFINSFKYTEFDLFDLIIICSHILQSLNKAYPNLICEEELGYKIQVNNPYPRIFKDLFSFKLFKRLYENYKTSNNQLADFSFIYRKMKKDEHILVRPEEFKSWLSKEPFSINLGPGIKTIDKCSTASKEINYNNSKELTK
jgi:hypothetical protein